MITDITVAALLALVIGFLLGAKIVLAKNKKAADFLNTVYKETVAALTPIIEKEIDAALISAGVTTTYEEYKANIIKLVSDSIAELNKGYSVVTIVSIVTDIVNTAENTKIAEAFEKLIAQAKKELDESNDTDAKIEAATKDDNKTNAENESVDAKVETGTAANADANVAVPIVGVDVASDKDKSAVIPVEPGTESSDDDKTK